MGKTTPPRPTELLNSSVTWTIVAIGLSVIGYAWYLAAQQGTSQNQITDLERRMATLETSGSPGVQALKTQLEINSNRLGIVEQSIGKNINDLLIQNATQDSVLKDVQGEVGRLRDWRVSETNEISEVRKSLAEIRGDITALKARADMLSRWIETHQDRDEAQGQTVAALKLGIDALNQRLARLDLRITALLEGKGR
jgi:chromosome segregation ATPase